MADYQIQMPIDESIKKAAEIKAYSLGMKNLNDLIRFLLFNFASDRVSIKIDASTQNLSESLSLVEDMDAFTSLNTEYSLYKSKNFEVLYDKINEKMIAEHVQKMEEFAGYLTNFFDTKINRTIKIYYLINREFIKAINRSIFKSTEVSVNSWHYPDIVSGDWGAYAFFGLTGMFIQEKTHHFPKNIFLSGEPLRHFFKENGIALISGIKLPTNKRYLSKVLTVDWSSLGDYTGKTDFDATIDMLIALYAFLYNELGYEKFKKLINYFCDNVDFTLIDGLQAQGIDPQEMHKKIAKYLEKK